MPRAWLWCGTFAGGLALAATAIYIWMQVEYLHDAGRPIVIGEVWRHAGRPVFVFAAAAVWLAGMWWSFHAGRTRLAGVMSAALLVALAAFFLLIGPGTSGPDNLISAPSAR